MSGAMSGRVGVSLYHRLITYPFRGGGRAILHYPLLNIYCHRPQLTIPTTRCMCSVTTREQDKVGTAQSGVCEVDFSKAADTLKVKPTSDVLRAAFVLSMCSVNVLVDNSVKLMEMSKRLLGSRGQQWLLRATFYGMFVGGETEADVYRTVTVLQQAGINVMLAIPFEEDLGAVKNSEDHYDSNVESLCRIVEMSEKLCPQPRMMHFKISGFIRSPVLVALSEHVSNHGYDGGVNGEGSIGQLIAAMKDPESLPELSFLSAEDNQHLRNTLHRLYTIGQTAVKHDISLLVDAEFIYMRAGINALTLGMMGLFNVNHTYMWNTYQCYLKATAGVLAEDVKVAERSGFLFAAKLVRGAYMERERLLAKMSGDEDPVQPDYNATTENYYRVLNYFYDKVKDSGGRYKVMVASHNVETVKYAVNRMNEMNLSSSVIFGQVMGINDPLSLLLGENNLAVYKSVPYGSVEDTVPYLSRRALENRSVLQGIRNERKIYNRELLRRLNPFRA